MHVYGKHASRRRGDLRNPSRYGSARVFPLSHESPMMLGRSDSRNSRRQLRRKWDRWPCLLRRTSVPARELSLRVELVKSM